MKRFFVFTTLFLFIFQAALTEAAAPEPVKVFKGEGYAIKFAETADFKKSAIESAVKDSVVTAVKSLTGESLYKNAVDKLEGNIVLKGEQFILGYKLLSEGWMIHYDMPDAAAIIGETRDSEADTSVKVEAGPDEISGIFPPGSVEAYHVVVEAKVDMKTLAKEVRRYVAIADEKSEDVEIVILGVEDYRAFELLKDRLGAMDFIRTLTFVSFARGKSVLSASVTESGNVFYENLLKELGGEFVVIPGGAGRVIVKVED